MRNNAASCLERKDGACWAAVRYGEHHEDNEEANLLFCREQLVQVIEDDDRGSMVGSHVEPVLKERLQLGDRLVRKRLTVNIMRVYYHKQSAMVEGIRELHTRITSWILVRHVRDSFRYRCFSRSRIAFDKHPAS